MQQFVLEEHLGLIERPLPDSAAAIVERDPSSTYLSAILTSSAIGRRCLPRSVLAFELVVSRGEPRGEHSAHGGARRG